MNNLNDDLLNKYIDNELPQSKIDEINEIIKKDDSELVKLSSHKFVHQTLKEIPVDDAPHNFTERIMLKINENFSPHYEVAKFFKAVITVFSLLIVAVLFIGLDGSAEAAKQTFANDITTNYIEKFTSLIPGLLNLLNGYNILLIGTGLVIVLFVATFYLLESHIQFKKKIEHYSK